MTNNENKSEGPKVSVIILTYNQEKYIAQCINSILEQVTEYSFEIVISDDKSTDSTQNIIKQYAKEYPDIIKSNFNENNLGIVNNYLRALDLCNGKYLCLIGGDDYLIDNSKIQKQVDFLELNPEYGLVYTDYSVLNESKGKVTEWVLKRSGKSTIEGDAKHIAYKGDNQIMSLTVCIRLQILNEDYRILMNDKYFLAEDFPTCFWVSMFAKFHFMAENTAVYRIHNRSFTNFNNNLHVWKFVRSHIYMRKKLMKYFKYMPDDWEESNSVTDRIILNLSLKSGLGKNIGIASYISLKKSNKSKLEDRLAYLGLRCSFGSLIIRGILLILKKLKEIRLKISNSI